MTSMLAARSDFSLGEAILSPESLIKHATDLGLSAVALTDTMSVTGMIDFSTKAQKAKIKPIIGARLRISEDAQWRPDKALGQKKKHMPKAYFVTFYVRSETGLKALFKLLSLANTEPRFYYSAKLDWSDVMDAVAPLTHQDYALVLGDEETIYRHKDIDAIMASITANNVCAYLPLIAVNTPFHGRVNEISIDYHTRTGLPLICIRPALYDEGHADAQEIMAGVVENTGVSEGWFRSRFVRDLHPLSMQGLTKEAITCAKHLIARGIPRAGAYFMDAINAIPAFVDAVTYQWSKSAPSLPKLADDEFAAVVEECKKGFVERFKRPMFGHTPNPADQQSIYLPRLRYELSVLQKLGFSPYFLTVQDIVRYAKSNGILVGPGRGSVGGSLVAYLMGITDIDPIRFGLLFERFINPERIDLPDADLDFMSERRHEIVDYLIAKFGQNRVAGVSNFGTLGAASAMRDVGRIVGIPERDYSVSKFVPGVHGQSVDLPTARSQVAEIADFASKYISIWPIMERLESTIRNMSQHAAGIVVAGEDIVNRAVVERRKESVVVNWDKRTIEEQGLVKIDLLGLTTLDVINLTIRYVEEHSGKKIAINEISLDDPAVLTAFAQGRTVGVFQFESGGMRKLLRDLGASTGTVTFDDITACTALYRPGPMESGMMDSFAKRKSGVETIDYDHPLMEPILKDTFGVMVYQEQVMKVSQVIAGYSGPDADKLRKIMGKKLPEEMAKERGKFIEGCVKTVGSTEEWAGALFDKIEGFAGYGFNKSHAAAYSLISYQCMFLKVNYPLEFYSAAMTMFGSDKLLGLMRDAKDNGVHIAFPDINKSSARFEIVRAGNEIVIPFQRIKGISEKTADAILKARAAGPFLSKQDFINRVEKRACNSKAQTALDLVGAFASIEPSQVSANDPSRTKDQVELLPGLVSNYVPIHRTMHTDPATRAAINDIVDEYRHAHGPGGGKDGMPVKPHFGRSARAMIITDCPSGGEEQAGIMGSSSSMSAVMDAMLDANLAMPDVYWTALIKRPKAGKQVSGDEISTYKTYLEREIDTLKPTVIVLMGSQTVRQFIPGFKGKASDVAGDVMYFRDLDANIVIGFNPGEIYHSPEKQSSMNHIFATVGDLLQ